MVGRRHDAGALGGRAAVRPRLALVGTPLRDREAELLGVGARPVAGPGRTGGGADDRADDPAPARRPLPRALVARGGAGLRRDRAGARAGAPVRGDDRHAADAQDAAGRGDPAAGPQGGRGQHARADRAGRRRDGGGERDGDRDRAFGARLHLGHVPRRPLHASGDQGRRRPRVRARRAPPHLEGDRLVGADHDSGFLRRGATDPAQGRDGAARGGAVRAARPRRLRPR